MIALIESYKAGLFTINNIQKNVVAGSVVGVVALPLALAFAIASGVKPEQGIYTAIIAGLIVGIFGGSRVQISGPTGAFVVVLAAVTAQYGIAGLQVATVVAGLLLCLMGLLKLGNAVKFIPYPVVVGFTSGIAVIIFVGQWKEFLGLPVSVPSDASFYQRVHLLGSSFHCLDMTTAFFSVASLGLLVFANHYVKSIPSPLLVMIGATVVQWHFSFSSVATIGSVFGSIPQTVPHFHIPEFSSASLFYLCRPAVTIALLGAFESLLSATVADSLAGTKHDSNQELWGQGLANIIAPFWGGFASTGAIARTVMNIKNGGNCCVAAIVHSLVLVSVLVFFAPYAQDIPLCVLSAILFVVAFNMSEIPHFVHVLKDAPWYDAAVLLVTFFLTIFTDLVVAVAVGVALALVFIAIRMRQTREGILGADALSEALPVAFVSEGVVYTVEGPLFFGVTEKIKRTLITTPTQARYVVFRFLRVPFIDISGLQTLNTVIDVFKKRGVRVYVCEANQKVSSKMIKNNIVQKIEGGRIFCSLKTVAEQYLGLSLPSF